MIHVPSLCIAISSALLLSIFHSGSFSCGVSAGPFDTPWFILVLFLETKLLSNMALPRFFSIFRQSYMVSHLEKRPP